MALPCFRTRSLPVFGGYEGMPFRVLNAFDLATSGSSRREAARRGAPELPELTDEVRLVGVAGLVGDARPVVALAETAPHLAQAEETSGRARGDADLLLELGDQMALAPSDLRDD